MDEQKKPEITEIAIVDERSIRDKIYVVRGVKVMLDFELAEIYGYTTSRFNEQVSNNIEKFEGDDFCFYLTQEEFKELKNLISKKSTSSWGGRRKPPRAFTESGLYMLMTVLRGDLATQQSRALIRVFRAMKDFIVETQGLVTQRDLLRLSIQTAENTDAIKNMSLMLADQQKIIHFAAQKTHIGLYPGPETVACFAERLDEYGLRYSKGSIQIPYSDELPLKLVSEIAAWCRDTGNHA